MKRNQEMLYPKSREYPFDSTIEELVRELERLKFDVPGIEVKFKTLGPYLYVEEIKSDDYRLWFCRVQGRLSDELNDIAAVTTLVIPGKELNVYEGYSGPTLYVYVGEDWKRDRNWFMKSLKVNSKLRGEPRRYLKYKDSDEVDKRVRYIYGRGRFWRFIGVAKYLIHDNDLGREYDPVGDEPRFYRTEDIFNEFDCFFKKIVDELKQR